MKLYLKAPDYKTCPICKTPKHKLEFYPRSKTNTTQRQPYCIKCSIRSITENKHNLKKEIVQYKGGKCILCGYNKNIKSLVFHHIDSSVKEFSISGVNYNLEKLKKEIDKCILVCRNCHAEIHEGLHPQYLINVTCKSISSSEKKICPRCKEEKSIDSFYKKRKKEGHSCWCIRCDRKDNKKRYLERRKIAFEYKGYNCIKCGYNKCLAALDCHHVNPNEKDFKICDFKGNIETLKQELDKCNLLCRNCHGELTFKKLY
jgi:hypothetical protein